MIDLIYAVPALVGLAALHEDSVDFVFADLPYGVTQNRWDVPLPFEALWSALRRVCRPRAALVFTAVQPFTSRLVMSNPREFRHAMVWRKNKSSGGLSANTRPLRAHEDIVVFARKPPRYRVIHTEGHAPSHGARRATSQGSNYGRTVPGTSTYQEGMTRRYPTSILDIPVVNNDDPARIHPTQKPVELVSWFLRAYTEPGDLVLDPTAGSGTTCVAAVQLGRRAVGFEADPEMARRANARCRAALNSIAAGAMRDA